MASQTKIVPFRLGASGSAAWYSFALTSAQVTTIDLGMLFGAGTVTLTGTNGRILARADASTASDGIVTAFLGPGTYTVNTSAIDEAAGSLTVSSGAASVGSQGSSVAGPSQATARLLGTVGSGALTIAEWVGPNNPSDWYAFNVASVSDVRVTLSGMTAGMTVNLRGPAGQVLASSTATALIAGSIVQALPRLATGSYFIDVEGGAASGYALSVAAPPIPEAAGMALATAADLGQPGAGGLHVTDQLNANDLADYYQFHVAGPSTALIHAAGLTASATVTLYDAYGSVLATRTGGLGNDAWLSQDLMALPPGSAYGVSVSGTEATPYTLSVSAQSYAISAASPATAVGLGPVSTQPLIRSGTLHILNPQQYYAFTLASPATLDAVLTASGSAQIQLYTAAFVPVGPTVYQAAGPGTVLVADQLAAGAYYAAISALNPTDAPSYSLSLSTGTPPTGTPDQNAAGYSRATAALIGPLAPIPATYADWVGPTNPDDFYRFSVDAEALARFDLTGLAATATVTIEDAGGRFIASSSGGTPSGNTLYNTGASLTQLLAPGSYSLDISSTDGVGTGYSLAASAQPVIDQGGKSLATATALAAPNTAVLTKTGYLSPAMPDAYYQFTLAAPATISLLLSGTNAVTTVALLSASGNPIASGQTGTVSGASVGENGSVIQTLAAGSYVVDVQASGPGVVPYTLSVSATPSATGGASAASAVPLGIVRDNGGLALAREDFGWRGSTITVDAGLNHVLSNDVTKDTLGPVSAIQFLDGTLSYDVNGPGAQVARLYQAALGRAPDQAGLSYWVRSIQGGAPLDALSSSFLGSAEFIARFGSLDDTGFVTRLYRNVLGRAPDAAGDAYWVNHLAGGETRANVLTNFSESAENVTGTGPTLAGGVWLRNEPAAEIARLYDTVFGRLPDVAGLSYWLGQLTSGVQTMAQVTQAFITSPEFLATYGALTNAGFVQALYQNTLHRAPDNAGLTYWTSALVTGANTKATVVYSFADSAEHRANTAAIVGGETPGQYGIQFGPPPG